MEKRDITTAAPIEEEPPQYGDEERSVMIDNLGEAVTAKGIPSTNAQPLETTY